MPPAGFCPKCIGVRKEGAVVCPFCGLDYARFKADESRPGGAVASTWLGVLELWDSRGAHDKVLALASERGELAALGRLYRIRLARNPEDAMAKRGREEVLRLAAASSTLLRHASAGQAREDEDGGAGRAVPAADGGGGAHRRAGAPDADGRDAVGRCATPRR